MNHLRDFFSASTGSRARNITRVLVALGVSFGLKLSGEQVAAVLIAVEVVFSGGQEVASRV